MLLNFTQKLNKQQTRPSRPATAKSPPSPLFWRAPNRSSSSTTTPSRCRARWSTPTRTWWPGSAASPSWPPARWRSRPIRAFAWSTATRCRSPMRCRRTPATTFARLRCCIRAKSRIWLRYWVSVLLCCTLFDMWYVWNVWNLAQLTMNADIVFKTMHSVLFVINIV